MRQVSHEKGVKRQRYKETEKKIHILNSAQKLWGEKSSHTTKDTHSER